MNWHKIISINLIIKWKYYKNFDILQCFFLNIYMLKERP